MASQVLSGSSNVTYANNTGENVRVIINYMRSPSTITWASISISTSNVLAIGKNLAFSNGSSSPGGVAFSSVNMAVSEGGVSDETVNRALPTEIMLANGQAFSATCGAYNIVVIPEGG